MEIIVILVTWEITQLFFNTLKLTKQINLVKIIILFYLEHLRGKTSFFPSKLSKSEYEVKMFKPYSISYSIIEWWINKK